MAEDNRTFWELSFVETGLSEAQKRAAALEEGFNKIKAAADAARNTGSNFSSLLQPMSAVEMRAKMIRDMMDGIKSSLATIGSVAKQEFGLLKDVAAAAFDVMRLGASKAWDAMSKLDDVATKAFGERSATLRTYTTVLGDAQQAQIEYHKATDLAMKTEFTQQTAIQSQIALINAGFRGRELDRALLATADITAMASRPEERTAKASHTALVFREIQAEGVLNKRMLNMIGKDINTTFIREALGGGEAGKGGERIHRGEVGAEEAMNAIYAAITRQLRTKQLGEFATASSSSIGTLLTNRSEAAEILLKSFDGQTLPAVIRYKEALTEQVDLLNSASANGESMVMMLSDFASITANVKTMWTDFSSAFLEAFVESYNEARKGSGSFIAMTDGIKSLGSALGKVGTAVGVLADGFEGFMEIMQPVAAYLAQFINQTIEAVTNLFTALDALKAGDYARFKTLMADAGSSFTAGFATIDFDDKAAAERRARIQAASEEATAKAEKKGPIAPEAVKMQWGRSSHQGGAGGGKGLQGYDITGLLGGSGGGGGSISLQNDLGSMVSAAGAVSSAPSAKVAAGVSGADSAASSSHASTHVTIEPGAIVVSGVSDPMAAAEDMYRLLGQRLGRISRAPGVRVL